MTDTHDQADDDAVEYFDPEPDHPPISDDDETTDDVEGDDR